MAKVTFVFDQDGKMEVSNEPGENAEKFLKQLGLQMGEIEKRGHVHGHVHQEGVKLGNK
ncbi:MAG: hypothetical protein Q8R28_15110 [Dehalococcoidia bacterium]|nr:hypothetical protein [Dehalococcoidia bacterium]